MANEEHIAILKQGVVVWNEWREGNPAIIPDLAEANLNKANFIKANFIKANLIEANLGGAYLNKANLSGAYLNKANLSGAYLSEANLSGAYLSEEADLSGANLNKADLRWANLGGANLNKANLREADLGGAYLDGAEFIEADLREANLREADLRDAYLRDADLCEANLRGADLRGTYLRGADWTETRLGFTNFRDIDLSQIKGLETVKHDGPSYIDIQTIYRSGGNIPEVFLRGAGVPDTFITFMRSLTTAAFEFYSCFISHSSKDKEFVERLYADLQSKGVRCWYAPEDLKIGEPFLLGIERGILLHEKLLLVLSEHSVGSNWVQHEVLSAMAKEGGKEPWVLFPIRLDNAVMDTNVLWASMIRQSRHIGDFSKWKDHDSYRKAFDRLMRDLKATG